MTKAEELGETVRVRVPAKINLALQVGPLGADGYHPLVSLFQAVALHDEVLVRASDGIELEVRGSTEDLGPVEDNLAVRAARLLADRHQVPARIAIELRKRIPVAGGLAGGSADAAGALLAASVLWDLDAGPEELTALAAELGSDVPFALLGGTALGTGRGHELVPVLTRGSYHWVLAASPEGLSTAAVYRRFDELGRPGELSVPDQLINALLSGDACQVAPHLRNDLAPATLDLRPELQHTLDAGLQRGAVGAMISGSGPTCAFLCRNEDEAIQLSMQLAHLPGVARTLRVTGPSLGARVVNCP